MLLDIKDERTCFYQRETPVEESLSANELVFFIAEFERAAKIRKIAVYCFLISLLVAEL